MARIEIDPNYNAPTFSRATAPTDVFKKEDIQSLAAAVSTHVHDGAGKGLLVSGPGAGSITNAQLGPSVARASLLVNGGFEQWQRGTGPFTTNSVYTADRWLLSFATSTVSVSRSASTIGSNGFSQQLAYTQSGAGTCSFQQKIEDRAQLQGKTVTFACTVKSTVAGTVRLWWYDGATITNGAYNVGTGSERLTLTFTVPSGAADLQVAVQVGVASCTVEMNDATLVVGSQAADYVPLHPADDLARCQRYYAILGETPGSLMFAVCGAAAVGSPRISVPYKARVAVTPTVTIVGTWATSACGQPVLATAGVDMARFQATTTAIGDAYVFNNNAGNIVTIEANP